MKPNPVGWFEIYMGSVYPDLYAAVCVHSGLACGAASDMPSAFNAMRQGGAPNARTSRTGSKGPVPTIVFHGDQDKTVSPVNGEQVIAQSKAGTDLRQTVNRGKSESGATYTCTVQADEQGRPVLEHWVLHGAGHAWAGGSSSSGRPSICRCIQLYQSGGMRLASFWPL